MDGVKSSSTGRAPNDNGRGCACLDPGVEYSLVPPSAPEYSRVLAPPGPAGRRTCLDLGAQLGELGVGGAAVELVHDLRGGWVGPSRVCR
jgi:hypothetical protein